MLPILPKTPRRRSRFSFKQMDVKIRYGDRTVSLNLPDTADFEEISCKAMSRQADCDIFLDEIARAGKESFPCAESDLIVVNDAYRRTPTETVLDWMIKSGRLPESAAFLVATGTHPVPDSKALKKIFGKHYESVRDRIFAHDCRDNSGMVQVGSVGGTPVSLNKRFVRARRVIVIGSVEPHYFAGFTGGRKSIFPGLCDFETIARNHNLAVSFEAAPMKLDGNPVEENLRLILSQIDTANVISIQAVIGREGETSAIFCGSLGDSFLRACEISREIFSARYKEPYDLILAEIGSPLDANLYQLQKALENNQSAVKDGGKMILFSPCKEGIGTRNFYDLAGKWDQIKRLDLSPVEKFGMHKLARVEKIASRIEVYLHSELDDGIPEKVFYRSAANPQKIIDESTKIDNTLKTALVRDAGHTVLLN